MDLKAKLCGNQDAPLVVDFIAGLGGREVNINVIREIVQEAEKAWESSFPLKASYWVGLDTSILT